MITDKQHATLRAQVLEGIKRNPHRHHEAGEFAVDLKQPLPMIEGILGELATAGLVVKAEWAGGILVWGLPEAKAEAVANA